MTATVSRSKFYARQGQCDLWRQRSAFQVCTETSDAIWRVWIWFEAAGSRDAAHTFAQGIAFILFVQRGCGKLRQVVEEVSEMSAERHEERRGLSRSDVVELYTQMRQIDENLQHLMRQGPVLGLAAHAVQQAMRGERDQIVALLKAEFGGAFGG